MSGRYVWYLRYKGYKVEVPRDLILNVSDMTANYMAGGVDDLIWDEGANMIATLSRCLTYLSPHGTNRWDTVEILGTSLHEVLAEYLTTEGGTFHLIDVAYRTFERLVLFKQKVGSAYMKALSDWEEECHASSRILKYMRESGALEDKGNRMMWPDMTHLGRDVCRQMVYQLGEVEYRRGRKRTRYQNEVERVNAEYEQRRHVMNELLLKHGNDWPMYDSQNG